ncbi:MAG: lysine--tRNA ligase [Candidatus Andersenbacteria bacterium]
MPKESTEERLRSERINKLQALIKAGVNPYPSRVQRTHNAAEFSAQFERLKSSTAEVSVTGRVRALRRLGKAAFVVLEDLTGRVQAFVQKDQLGKDFVLVASIEVGDFVGVRGTAFVTKTGEKSVRALAIAVLSKALRPLPDKFHGLKDQELRYRHRELDLIVNPEVRDLFQKRALLERFIRDFLDGQGFLEVETPVLQAKAGGTEATPFATHHNALDIDLYLRIAPELFLKRLVVGGLEQVYEMGKIFRNEGVSPQHLQEFTELEFYWAYKNYLDLMPFTEQLITSVLQRTYGTLEFTYGKHTLNFAAPWKRLDYYEAVKTACDIDLSRVLTVDELRRAISKRKLDVHLEPHMGYGRMIDNLFKATVRPGLVQPTFVTDHPLAISPLAKRNQDKPGRVERFQLVVAGFEIVNAYSELNDPRDQQARFEEQAKLREAGDAEAHVNDEDFVESLEYGLPPTAGWGMGIDRLLTLVHNVQNIRDVVLFPLLRPKEK